MNKVKWIRKWVTILGIAYPFALLLFAPDSISARFYPVLVNGIFLFWFARSLFIPPSAAEKIARIKYPSLPPEGVAYCAKVTVVWCIFFIINGGIGLYTALWTSIETWALYNGVISYILIGTLFIIEYMIRRRIIKKITVILLFVLLPGIAEGQTTDVFSEIIKKISVHPVVRSQFEQKKYISALNNPVQTKGSFLFALDKGVIWNFQHPLVYSFIATKNGILKKEPGRASVYIDASAHPEAGLFTTIFLALFQADVAVLSEFFEIDARKEQDNRWTMVLKGKPYSIGKYIQAVHIAGRDAVTELKIIEANGDRSEIKFEPAPFKDLSPEEIESFNEK